MDCSRRVAFSRTPNSPIRFHKGKGSLSGVVCRHRENVSQALRITIPNRDPYHIYAPYAILAEHGGAKGLGFGAWATGPRATVLGIKDWGLGLVGFRVERGILERKPLIGTPSIYTPHILL